MNIDFEQLLFWATVVTGLIVLADWLYFRRRRKQKTTKEQSATKGVESKPAQFIVEYSRAFFPILLVVFLLRSFVFEPFRIPSGSLEPTLLMGDFILANKYDYGLRMPVFRHKLLNLGQPQRGDIIVFRWPPDPHYYFIKRVIGLPGDRIDYVNKVLSVNGQEVLQTSLPTLPAEKSVPRETGEMMQVIEKQEDLFGVKHNIYQEPRKMGYNFQNIRVPEGMYMVMGDNRDDSADSRYWGFVPEENIVGKAVLIWMSWDSFAPYGIHKVRWERIGRRIH